jgi:AmmeMemoRadiSam system protein B
MIRIREAAVAGSFYPADPGELQCTVRRLLEAAPAGHGPAPKALVVPHAGYAWSGAVAATAYARLLEHRQRYRRVVMLGPCHYVACTGLAVSGVDAFNTPLGSVMLDRASIDALRHPAVSSLDAVHRPEHSLEVQLPFLQCVLDSFTLVPLLVGDCDAAEVAEVIECLWGGAETLVVVSSDLSHYLGYDAAQDLDSCTCRAIEALDGDSIGHDAACGASPLHGLLLVARRRGMQVATLDLRNSGDVSGDRRRVVGYGAWSLLEREPCARAA